MGVSFWVWTVVLAFLFLFLLPTYILSAVLYTVLLVRTSPRKWDRECSMPEDPEYVGLYEEALRWGELHRDRKRAVSVENDGLHLEGEYFDFGGDRAVIIVPGRMESCLYSYYYAEPYRAAGCNVLVIDNRAHGLSQGKYCTLGFGESRDILAWAALLHDELGNGKIYLHGVCIGASGALFALTSPDCPAYVAGMAADGMYTTFYESFKNHMRDGHHPVFPFSLEVMAHIRLIAGVNVVTDGPIRRIDRLKKPILFLHSREDVFSRPEMAQALYDRCTAPKTLRWFPEGGHSRVRYRDPAGYDEAIAAFLGSV